MAQPFHKTRRLAAYQCGNTKMDQIKCLVQLPQPCAIQWLLDYNYQFQPASPVVRDDGRWRPKLLESTMLGKADPDVKPISHNGQTDAEIVMLLYSFVV